MRTYFRKNIVIKLISLIFAIILVVGKSDGCF